MKVAFYPGSFSPWHEGHGDVATKALQVFDKIVILQLTNADKKAKKIPPIGYRIEPHLLKEPDLGEGGRIQILEMPNMSINSAIGNYLLGEQDMKKNQYAIIRGLRNEQDFCQDQILQYWYEDLGIKLPIMYIISDRALVHVSSSAIRASKKFTK